MRIFSQHSRKNLKKLLKQWAGLAVLISLLIPSLPASASSQIPKILNYQARITDASGVPVADGNLNIWIKVYDAPSGGTCLYSMKGSCGTPSFKTVTVSSGVFSMLIGETGAGDTEIPDSLFDNNVLFLGVTVASDTEMVPRKRIAASPYALNADKLDDLDVTDSGSTTPYVVSTTSNGNLVVTGDPQGSAVSNGSVYVNPASAAANETLFGIASAGSSRFAIDKEGDVTHTGSLLATAASSTSQFIFRGAVSQSTNIFEVQDSLTNRMLSVSATATTIGSTSSTDAVVFNSRIGSNLTPTLDNTFSLGDYNRRWKDLWLSGGSANIAYDTSGTTVMRLGFDTSATTSGIIRTLGTNIPLRLTTGSNTGIAISELGYVGVGTTNPQSPLEVNGALRFSTNLYFTSGTPYTGNRISYTGSGFDFFGSGNQAAFIANTNGSSYLMSSLGIKNSAPANAFTVGTTSTLEVDINGNLVKIRNVVYSWPSSQGGATTVLQNNGSGTLSWASASGLTNLNQAYLSSTSSNELNLTPSLGALTISDTVGDGIGNLFEIQNRTNAAGDYSARYFTVSATNTTIGGLTQSASTSYVITPNAQIAGNLTPSTDNLYSLGDYNKRWRDLHLGPASLVIHNDAANTNKLTVGYSGTTAQILSGNAIQIAAGNASLTPGINISPSGRVFINDTTPSTTVEFYVRGTSVGSGCGSSDVLNAVDANRDSGLIVCTNRFTGINTSTPTERLEVKGTTAIMGGMKITRATIAAPTVVPQGTSGSTTWRYKVTAVTGVGESAVSAEGTTTTGNATLDSSNFNAVTFTKVPGAYSYKIYRTTAGGTPSTTGLIATSAPSSFSGTVTVNDTGLSATTAPPTEDTSADVGLGTTTPGARLTIVNGTESPSTNLFEIQNSNSSTRYFSVSSTSTLLGPINAGNYLFGIGNSAPANLLTVGSATSTFEVNTAGNLVKINNVAYSWPSSQGGASTILQNNGSGTLSWVTAGSGATLQTAYANSSATSSEIYLDSTRGALTLADSFSSFNGNLFEIQDRTNGVGDYSRRHFTVSSTSTLINPSALSTYEVGIGTTDPVVPFHVRRTSNGEGMRLEGTTNDIYWATVNPSVSVFGAAIWDNPSSDANYPAGLHGFFGTGSAHALSFRTTNLSRMIITSGGSVGIGVHVPDTKLHVLNGSAGSVTATGNTVLTVENSTNGYVSILTPDASESGVIFGSPVNSAAGGVIYNSALTLDGLQFRTNGNSTKMVIDSAGDVGIGTTTPGAPLHIVTAGTTPDVLIDENTAGAAVQIDMENNSRTWRIASDSVPDLFTIGSGADTFVITPTGDVGIGTITPAGTETFSQLTIEGSDSTALYSAVINTGTGQAGMVLNRTGGTASRWVTYTPTASTNLRFFGGGADRMTITGTGDVGIGNNAPANRLTVGSATSTFEVNSAGNLIKVNNVPYSWPSAQGGASTVLTNNGSGVLTWGAAGSGVANLQVAYNAASSTTELSISGGNALTLADTLSGVGNIFEVQDLTNPATGDYSRRYFTVSSTNTTIGGLTQSASTSHVITPNAQIAGNLTPSTDNLYSLGDYNRRWKDLWLSGGSANIAYDTSGTSVMRLGIETATGLRGVIATPSNMGLQLKTTRGTSDTNGIYIGTNGFVGIGNAAPSVPVNVGKTTGFSPLTDVVMSITGSGAGVDTFLLIDTEFTGDDAGILIGTTTVGEDAAIYMDVSDANKLKFSIGATMGTDAGRTADVAMTLTQAGFLGIGTTNPLNPLFIEGSGASFYPIVLNSTSDLQIGMSFRKVGQEWLLGADGLNSGGDDFFIYDATDAAFRLSIGGTGNVGLGDQTPDSLLDLLSSGAANTVLKITNTNAGDFDPSIGFELAEGTHTFTMGVDDSDADKFKISTTALGTSDRFVIDSTGNVGIGTAVPSGRLTVNDTAAGSGAGALLLTLGDPITPADLDWSMGGGERVAIFNGGPSGGCCNYGSVVISNSNASPATGNILGYVSFAAKSPGTIDTFTGIKAAIGAILEGSGGAVGGFGAGLQFATRQDNGADLERMRISNVGNVGIGNFAPANRLTVGTATSTFEVNQSGNLVKVNNVVYSWPASQGGASTVLTNNGSGILTWAAAAGSSTTLQQAYDNDVNGGDVTITTNSTDGDIIIAGDQEFRVTTPFFNVRQTTDPTASNVTLHDFVLDTQWTEGTIINADFGATTTQTGPIFGSSFNFLNNLTTAGQSVTGYEVRMPVVTTSTFGNSYYGFNIPESGKLTQNATGTILAWAGLNMAFPDTQENTGSGILSATGVNIVGGAVSAGNTGSMTGVSVDLGTGASGGSITGIRLNMRGNTAATEQALLISDNWDNAITFAGTGQNSIGIGDGGNLVFRDGLGGSNFLMQLTDAGTKGNLSVTGNLTIGTASNTDSVDFTNARIASNLTPTTDNIFDLGDYDKRWKTLHVGPGSVIVHNDTTGTTKLTLGFSGTTPRLFSDAATSLTLDSSNGTVALASGDSFTMTGNFSVGGGVVVTSARALQNITSAAIDGTFELNRFSGSSTFIGDGGSGTITIGNTAGGNLVLNDPQWSITGAGVATFASFSGNLLPSANPTVGASSQTATLLDSSSTVTGFRSSVTIGTDGFPVISYYDSTNADLKVIKCGNAACSSGNTTTTVDSTGDVGGFSSIAIGTDGFPVISYHNNVFEASTLKVVKCGNAACSSGNTISTAASGADYGWTNSIAVGVGGFPIIAHTENTTGGLYVTTCGNASCSSGNTTTLQDANGLTSTSIAIGADGMPVIAYRGSSTSLAIRTCTTITCSSGATTIIDDPANVVGNYLKTLIMQDGTVGIAYNDASANDVKFAKCNNSKCSSTITISTLSSSDNVGDYISADLGPDGLPVISYLRRVTFDSDLRVIKCGNDSCGSGNTETAVETSGDVGFMTSIAIGTDGLPFITHHDNGNGDLRSVKCADAGCKETSSGATTGGVNIGSIGSYFRNIYAHSFWGKQFQIAGFDVAETYRVDDQTVSAGDLVRIADGSTGAAPTVEKSSKPYDATIGIVSTKPAIRLSEWEDDANLRAVALDGRVPTRVSVENGPIKAGDPITSSSEAGIGMKATKPGMIVGYALQAWNGPGAGTIEVFVKSGFHSGLAITTDGAKSLFNDDFAFLPPAYATSLQTAIASRELSFIGSAWDAASSTSVTRSISLMNEITSPDAYQFSFRNDAGDLLASLNQAGDLALAGSLTVNGGFDYAETFPSAPDLEAGDIVMVDAENANGYGVKKTSGAYENSAIGVISTKPGFLTGKKEEDTQPVALAGRVPVKVNLESGAIAPGDPITSSSTPGQGMKAVEPGRVIGIALQGATQDGTVLIFVNPSWWNGPTPVGPSNAGSGLAITQGSLIDFKNSVLSSVAAIISTSGTWSITSDGVLAAVRVEAGEVKTSVLTAVQKDEAAATAEGMIPAGSTAVVVHNPVMKANARVFVSFLDNPGSADWVAERGDGDFTIHLAQPATTDLPFVYWILPVDDQRTSSEAELLPEPPPAPDAEDSIVETSSGTSTPE